MGSGVPELCPCRSGKIFAACCGPLLTGEKEAETAESLMRSRYTAYVKRDVEYLLQTWHPSTRPGRLDPGSIPDWCNLVVKKAEDEGRDGKRGLVEFIAVAHAGHKSFTMHEISHFLKEDGRWLYVNGDIIEPEKALGKVGRNDPCPCGSGKKFKKCCGR